MKVNIKRQGDRADSKNHGLRRDAQLVPYKSIPLQLYIHNADPKFFLKI